MPKQALAFPLSFAQQRMWFLDQLAPATPLYNIAVALRLNMRLHIRVLERSLNEIVGRHEILRTTFTMVNDTPTQIVAPSMQLVLQVMKLEQLQPEERTRSAFRIASVEAKTPFNLERGPLLRVALLTIGEDDHVFVLTMHHIVSDAWSVGVFFQELNAIYPAFCMARQCPLDELPIQYVDFAVWQREWLKSEVLERQLNYWKGQLSHLPQLRLPTDQPRPAMQTFAGDEYMLRFSKGLVSALNELGHREGVTLFMTLLAAFQILLSRYSGQEDLAVGSPIAGRNWAETEKLIGFFVNTLVLRADLSGNPTFCELLRRVREVTLGAYTHQDLPFEMLVDELHVERDLSRNPLFQVMFQLRNTSPVSQMKQGMNASPVPLKRVAAIFDLAVSLWETEDGIRGSLEYNSDLFEPSTIARLASHYEYILQAVVADPQQHLSELHLMTREERERVLVEWNATAEALPEGVCFHHLVESKTAQQMDAVAIEFEGERVQYGELNARANRIAHYLQGLGVRPEVLVGVYMQRSSVAIECVLAILKAGGAYLPLDPTYPKERTAFMIRDAMPSIVLTQDRFRERLPQSDCTVVCLDNDWKTIRGQSATNPDSNTGPDNLAYLIYTSGSTGTPKGVLVRHLGLVNVVRAQSRNFSICKDSRVLQFASLTFDASVFEIALALGAGATLCLGSAEELIPGAPLARFIRDHKVTAAVLPPSVLATLLPVECPSLRTIMAAGEACNAELVAHWAPGRSFFNLYGPTEATIWTTVANCREGTRKPSIGRPITNTQVYLLDRYQQPVPIGIPGEIYIGGVGLARGYLKRPDASAERFVRNPFQGGSPQLLYKSGDLARYLADGQIDFLGRADHQIKLRGFRIELGEIETVLGQHPGVREAVVVVRQGRANPGSLIAYVVPPEGTLLDKSELRAFVQEMLPAFMVPSIFVVLESMPRLPSGKVDRNSLPEPGLMDVSFSSNFQSPQTDVEQKIAGVWREVLGIDKVGIHENFFELGGNSLQIARVHSKLAGVLGGELGILDLFRYPTIHTLARRQVAVNPVEIRRPSRGPASTEQLAAIRKIMAARRETK